MEKKEIVEKFSEFLDEYYKNELLTSLTEGRKSVSVDFSLLEKFDFDLADYLLENPDETLEALEESVAQVDTGLAEAKIKLRFCNLPESKKIRIRNIRAENLGKLFVVEGQVKRASEIRPEVSESIFSCNECGNKISIIQTERIVRFPTECDNCDNRRSFKLVSQKLFDARWLVIEEFFEVTEGERPSDLKIYLKEDLTSSRMQNKTDPGNRVKVTGTLKELPKRIKGVTSRQMDIYLEANNVEPVEVEWEEIEINSESEAKIIELAKSPDIYAKLVRSIAPAIYGLESVKEGIALQLFGGEIHIQKDKSRVRGDIHILLVGDPSTAKSAMMKVVSTLIPRGKYVSGKGVTGAGLTATVVKDEDFLGGWVLEAGAMVMCNRSLCCIDEFEKIDKSDLVALHEAMEQNTISIAKANIIATLPAQTSVLAGGNPKFGRFDPYIPIKEQIEIPETILARFDLKFALKDIPNIDRDTLIADHILRSRHYNEQETAPEIEPTLLRKYIAYARKNHHPRLMKEAGEEIKRFFIDMRSKVTGVDAPVPITLRQYEALIRLAEASAKVQLRDTVTKEDALRSINLMKASLREFGLDMETGMYDIDRAEGQKATAAQRSKIRIVFDIIEELITTYGKEIPIDDIIKRAKDKGVERPEEIIGKMHSEGMLFSPRQGFVQKL